MSEYVENWINFDSWSPISGAVSAVSGTIVPSSGLNPSLQFNRVLLANIYVDAMVKPDDDLYLYFTTPTEGQIDFFNMSSILQYGVYFEREFGSFNHNIIFAEGNNPGVSIGSYTSVEPHEARLSISSTSLSIAVTKDGNVVAEITKSITYNDNFTLVVSPGRNIGGTDPSIGRLSIIDGLSSLQSQIAANSIINNQSLPSTLMQASVILNSPSTPFYNVYNGRYESY